MSARLGPSSLDEVVAAMPGRVRPTPTGAKSNECPCCPGHRRPSKTALVVTEKPNGVVAYCHLCHARHTDISRALGVRLAGCFPVNHLPDDLPPDEGPFDAAAEVEANIRKGIFDILAVDYGDDEIGRLTTEILGHSDAARRRTTRLWYEADEGPCSRRWVIRVGRRLGHKIGSTKSQLIAERVRDRAKNGFHYYPKHVAKKKNRLGLRIFSFNEARVLGTTRTRTTTSSTRNPAWSWSPEGDASAGSVAEDLLLAVRRANSPPLQRERPPSKLTLAQFLGQEAAAA